MVPNPIELRAEHTDMLTLQAIPSHVTIPAARAGRTFQRMPSQSAHRHRRALGPPTGADRTARRRPRDPHTGASSALVPVPPRPSCRYPLDPHTDKVISPGMKHSHPRERTLDEGPHPIPHNKRGGEHGQTHRHQRRYRSDVIAATLSSVIATPSFASHSPICATRQTRTTSRKMSSSSSYVPPMTLRATSTSGAGSFA